jgi:hypothetical protein
MLLMETKKTEYENPWLFDDKTFTSEDIDKFAGFVYLITNTVTGEKYIGRKYFSSIRKKKKTDKRRTRSESDWKEYYGSSEVLKKQVESLGKQSFRREILSLHTTKGDVNYAEVRELFMRDVLEKDGYINDNINGKWFRKPEHIKSGRKISARSSWRTSE